MYKILIKPSALKEISRLPNPIIKRIGKAIDDLAKEPRPDGVKKLKGQDENVYRIRVGDYRVVYVIDDEIKIINVNRVGHRKDIYRL